MGSLKLPASGPIYVDTQSIIYSVEQHLTYAPLLRPLWLAQSTGSVIVTTSKLSFMECLVMPLRNRDARLVNDFEQTFRSATFQVAPIDDVVLRRAAELRALHRSLRTPDAIHAATAFIAGATMFVTNDRGFRAVAGLPLALLDDILASP